MPDEMFFSNDELSLLRGKRAAARTEHQSETQREYPGAAAFRRARVRLPLPAQVSEEPGAFTVSDAETLLGDA